jgi:hypothetical protein
MPPLQGCPSWQSSMGFRMCFKCCLGALHPLPLACPSTQTSWHSTALPAQVDTSGKCRSGPLTRWPMPGCLGRASCGRGHPGHYLEGRPLAHCCWGSPVPAAPRKCCCRLGQQPPCAAAWARIPPRLQQAQGIERCKGHSADAPCRHFAGTCIALECGCGHSLEAQLGASGSRRAPA